MNNRYLNFSNILTAILIIFLGYKLYTNHTHNSKFGGKTLPLSTGYNYQTKEFIDFPPKMGKAIAIFWSSTCPPCMAEMTRLATSVNDGKIPREKIFAINLWENDQDILKFIKKKGHPFTYIRNSQVAKHINIQGTPTTLFLENQKIQSIKTGMSLFGIWQAEWFITD